jgi:hypothetical protein
MLAVPTAPLLSGQEMLQEKQDARKRTGCQQRYRKAFGESGYSTNLKELHGCPRQVDQQQRLQRTKHSSMDGTKQQNHGANGSRNERELRKKIRVQNQVFGKHDPGFSEENPGKQGGEWHKDHHYQNWQANEDSYIR